MMYGSHVLVLQISPMRMGSTWQFNTARESLILGERPLFSSMLDMEIGKNSFQEKNKNILLKSHFFDIDELITVSEGLDIRFIVSCRNLFDTMQSSRRVFPLQSDEITLTNIKNTLGVIRRIYELELPCHMTYMDSLNSHDELFAETEKIARFLGLELSNDLISQTTSKLSKKSVSEFIANQLDLQGDFNKWDNQTLWHGSHISASAISHTIKHGTALLPDRNTFINEKAEEFSLDKLENQVDSLFELIAPITQQRDELTQQRDELTQQRDELTQQRDELTQQRDELTQQRDELMNSTIWKLTKPIRDLINFIK